MSTGKGSVQGGGVPEEYLYDVFLSYSFKSDVREWVHTKFLAKFESALEDELIQLGHVEPPPKGHVCAARREIDPGDVWPVELQ